VSLGLVADKVRGGIPLFTFASNAVGEFQKALIWMLEGQV
jgi:hypothetical protein